MTTYPLDVWSHFIMQALSINLTLNKYLLLYAGQQVDVVYDPQNIAKVRIEAKGHEPFYAEPAKVGIHVGKKPKRTGIDRIPVDSSRLLDAVTRTAEERERRAVISYTQAMEGDENV